MKRSTTTATALREFNLVLFFTRGVSLETWSTIGTLERELRFYRELLPHVESITLVTYGGSEDFRIARELTEFRVVCNRFGLPDWAYRAFLRWVLPRLWSGPTLVKSNQIHGADVALAAARTASAPFVARCGYLPAADAECAGGRESEPARAHRAYESSVFGSADRVIVTTEALRDFVIDRYRVLESRITVVPNSVDVERFTPLAGAPPVTRRLCYVGRLNEEQKNLKALMEACDGLDVELCFIGAGPLEAFLRRDAERRGVRTHFLGSLENTEIPEQLQRSTAFVLPSRFEGHPKALLEAMACGLPVIGTDVPGIREVLRHCETGFLCEPTAESLRVAIACVMGDANLRHRLGRAAREAILESASLEGSVRRELALLDELAHQWRPKQRLAGAVAGKLRRLAHRALRTARRALPAARVETLLTRLAVDHAKALPAREALEFLFRLDHALYPVQGQKAVEYGNGVHTKHRHMKYHDFFVDRIDADDRVLDVGCGIGALAHSIAKRSGASVLAIDLDASKIATASERHRHPRVEYRVGDVLEGIPQGEVQVVVLSNVLEHLPWRPEFLSKLSQLPGIERLLVRVPLFERDWRVPLKRELGIEWRLDPTHETEYTLESFAEEVREAGLDVEHLEVRWGEIWCELHVPTGTGVDRIRVSRQR